MTLNITELLGHLEINDLRLNNVRNQIIGSLANRNNLQPLINEQCLDEKETGCMLCDEKGECAILNGIIYINLNKLEEAIKELENAKQLLHNKYETWDRIVGLALLGIAFERSGKKYLALREYKRAHDELKNIYLRVHANEYVEKAQILETELASKLTKLSTSSLSPIDGPEQSLQQSKLESPSTPSKPASTDKDYLALFSIPIYGTVEAGLDGTLHIDHFNIFTVVNQVELKKQLYDVYNVHGTVDADRQIRITSKREHGWLRVHGLSMNGWELPFNENDYVLFYKSQSASHLDYVIASNADPSDEISLMVKRFDEQKNELISKSTDTSKPYDPIPVDKGHQILGIVIAIAKLAQ